MRFQAAFYGWDTGSLKMERRRLADILGNQRGGFDALFGDEPSPLHWFAGLATVAMRLSHRMRV